jgi:hypothetical protein
VIRYGLCNGSADLIGLRAYRAGDPAGQFVAIEVKAHTGRQSPEQFAFQVMVETLGGVYILARSVEDVEEAL